MGGRGLGAGCGGRGLCAGIRVEVCVGTCTPIVMRILRCRIAAQLEFELPALRLRGVHGHAVHFQRADVGDAGFELHLDLCRTASLRFGQHGGDWGQALQAFVAVLQGDEIPRTVAAIGGAGGQVEAHGPAEAQAEAPVREPHGVALGRAVRQHADALAAIEREVVGTGGAAADAGRAAGAGHGVGDGAACDGGVEPGFIDLQQADGRGAGRLPAAQGGEQAVAQGLGVEHAAVEQHGVGQGAALALQEGGDVAGDGGVVGVGQAEFDEGAARPRRLRIRRHLREESFDQQPVHVGAREGGGARAADQPAAAALERDGGLRGAVRGEQALLGAAAALGELRELDGRERGVRGLARLAGLDRGPARQPRLDPAREREVHVVAAEHEVVAHAGARELRLAGGVQRDIDEREVGGAAAHIDHEQAARVGEWIGQIGAVREDPVVERGLRLFDEVDGAEAGECGGLEGELARAFVERGGHGEHGGLLRERRLGVGVVPGVAQVAQIAGAGLQRGDLGHLMGRAPGQDGGGAVHGGVRQPALGAGHEPAGRLLAEFAREGAEDGGLLRWPGQGQVGLRERACGRMEAQRGQQGPRRDFAGRDALRDGEDLDVVRAQGREREHGVGRAQVDADAEGGRHHASRTSNSTFHCAPPDASASNSSVPMSVTRARNCTGTTSPAERPSAGSVASICASSCSSSGDQKSSRVPGWSSRRTDDPKKRKRTDSPTTRPSCCGGRGASEPSSMPKGATHRACTGGSRPGTAGMLDSMPT